MAGPDSDLIIERARLAAFAITSVWEGSRTYSNYQTYDSGIISYGRFQFTLSSGNLGKVVDSYLMKSSSDVAQNLRSYQSRVSSMDSSLQNDVTIKQLLIEAADEPEMQIAQDDLVTANFWSPALSSAEARGLIHPLSLAFLFDTAVQHGPYHHFLVNAEDSFGIPRKTPAKDSGVSEEDFMTKAAALRKENLYKLAESRGLPGVKPRADLWVDLMASGDWRLQGDDDGNISVNGVAVQVKQPFVAQTAPTTRGGGRVRTLGGETVNQQDLSQAVMLAVHLAKQAGLEVGVKLDTSDEDTPLRVSITLPEGVVTWKLPTGQAIQGLPDMAKDAEIVISDARRTRLESYLRGL
ncbi:MAG: chitosanase [Chloroflexi bacterium]|nr:chitosanase [Chloroflexota bacterium]